MSPELLWNRDTRKIKLSEPQEYVSGGVGYKHGQHPPLLCCDFYFLNLLKVRILCSRVIIFKKRLGLFNCFIWARGGLLSNTNYYFKACHSVEDPYKFFICFETVQTQYNFLIYLFIKYIKNMSNKGLNKLWQITLKRMKTEQENCITVRREELRLYKVR